MRSAYLAIAFFGLGTACSAGASNMFKCVAPDGKVSYSDRQCDGKVKTSKEVVVRSSYVDKDPNAPAVPGSEQWRAAEEAFQQRRAAGLAAEESEQRAERFRRQRIESKERAKAHRQNEALRHQQEANRRNHDNERAFQQANKPINLPR